MKWISVDFSQPGLNAWIVARNGNKRPFTCRLRVLHNDIFNGVAYLDADNLQRTFTHWMPLPDPPEDRGNVN